MIVWKTFYNLKPSVPLKIPIMMIPLAIQLKVEMMGFAKVFDLISEGLCGKPRGFYLAFFLFSQITAAAGSGSVKVFEKDGFLPIVD